MFLKSTAEKIGFALFIAIVAVMFYFAFTDGADFIIDQINSDPVELRGFRE